MSGWLNLGFTSLTGGFRSLAGIPDLRDRRTEPASRFIATCNDCTPILPMPFTDAGERADWVALHRDFTGHSIALTDVAAPERGREGK